MLSEKDILNKIRELKNIIEAIKKDIIKSFKHITEQGELIEELLSKDKDISSHLKECKEIISRILRIHEQIKNREYLIDFLEKFIMQTKKYEESG